MTSETYKKAKHIPVHITNYSKVFDRFNDGKDRELIEHLFKYINKPFEKALYDGIIWFDGESDDGYGCIQPACPDDFLDPFAAKKYAAVPFNAWCNLATGYHGDKKSYRWTSGSAPKVDPNDPLTWHNGTDTALYEDLEKKMELKAAKLEEVLNKELKQSIEFNGITAKVANKKIEVRPTAGGTMCPIFLKISRL